MSSSQNERTLVGGGIENKQGQTKGEGRSKLGNLEQTYLLNVPLYHTTTNLHTLSKEKPNDYKIVEGKNLATTESNQLHHLMTIFGNFINQGVASHRKIKTLRYLSLRSSAH